MNSKMNHHMMRISTILAAIAAVALTTSAASAAITGAGFTIDMAASAKVLDAIGTPEYAKVLMEESCDNPHLRIRANNKPAVMLTVSDSLAAGAELASFTISINDPMYLFGDGDGQVQDTFTQFVKESVFTDSGVSIVSNTLSADMRSLTITFDGLTAGKKVLFNVDLDVINDPAMFLFPDFRHVLHGAPLPGTTEAGDPASYSGTFEMTGMDPVTASGMFAQMTETPSYSNQNIRPYQTMDMIEVIRTEVPEPTSVVLAGLAIAGGLALRRRRK